MTTEMQADRQHAAVMAALLASCAWLMLPTLIHLAIHPFAGTAQAWLALALALGQFFYGWRLLFDAKLFAAIARGELQEAALDDMLYWLFRRKPSTLQPRTMLQRLAGARRLLKWYLILIAAYWLWVIDLIQKINR
ncbi:hypothetical protein [Chitinibacter sp. S2-10]|uniref:hypothetical protein n=1 Tax=Chitinibacter sp. S2-10 TaxID=3373597 RepID=UPI00397738F2